MIVFYGCCNQLLCLRFEYMLEIGKETLIVFELYMSTIWYFSYPFYRNIGALF